MNDAAQDRRITHAFHAELLRSGMVLDSDDSEADEDYQATRMCVLSEEDWKAGVQELREKRPDLFHPHGSAWHQHKSSQELFEKMPLGQSAKPLTYPVRATQVKAMSWHAPSTKDEPHAAEKFTSAYLLNSCPVLLSEDSEDDCSSVPAKRANVQMEMDFTAGVQELREKRPELFSQVCPAQLCTSRKPSFHLRKSRIDLRSHQLPHSKAAPDHGDDARVSTKTCTLSPSVLEARSPRSEDEPMAEKHTEPPGR